MSTMWMSEKPPSSQNEHYTKAAYQRGQYSCCCFVPFGGIASWKKKRCSCSVWGYKFYALISFFRGHWPTLREVPHTFYSSASLPCSAITSTQRQRPPPRLAGRVPIKPRRSQGAEISSENSKFWTKPSPVFRFPKFPPRTKLFWPRHRIRCQRGGIGLWKDGCNPFPLSRLGIRSSRRYRES